MSTNQNSNNQVKSGEESRWKDWTGASERTEWTDAFYSFSHDQRASPSVEEVDDSTSWRNVEWDEEREKAAKLIVAQEIQHLTEEERTLYENQASDFWDKFYSKHNHNFFKLRNYLPAEYPEVIFTQATAEQPILVEFGCGTGSTFFPLIDLNKTQPGNPFIYGLDFSSTAIHYIRSRENYDPNISSAFVCDLVKQELPDVIREEKVDVGLLIFVLSAINPSQMTSVLKKIFNSLKPSGLLIFRDYGLYDMTQMRFVAKKQRKIEESFYVRADGTRTYFFSLDVVRQLATDVGFEIESLKYDTRELQNRKRKLRMYRVWVSAKLRKPATSTPV